MWCESIVNIPYNMVARFPLYMLATYRNLGTKLYGGVFNVVLRLWYGDYCNLLLAVQVVSYFIPYAVLLVPSPTDDTWQHVLSSTSYLSHPADHNFSQINKMSIQIKRLWIISRNFLVLVLNISFVRIEVWFPRIKISRFLSYSIVHKSATTIS